MQNVLDDVVDKEAGVKPKLVGPPAPAGVGSAVRHISQEELDSYVEGRLSGARLDFVRGHLDACEACRAELTDLRTYKASAVGISQASSLKRELERRRRQRMLKTGATAAVAAAVVAVIGVVGWNKFGKAWVHTASVATAAAARAAAAQTPAAASTNAPPEATSMQPTGAAQTRTASAAAVTPPAHNAAPAAAASIQTMGAAQPRAANTVGVMPPAHNAAPATAASIQTTGAAQSRTAASAVAVTPPAQPRGTTSVAVASTAGAAPQQQSQASANAPTRAAVAAVAPATSAAQTRGAMPATTAAGPAAGAVTAGSTSFALLGPFGDEVSDDRPEFAWQPLEGATKYSIIIVDEGLRPIAHTRLKTTTWRPKKPLRRGRTYLWQVTAILKNGTKVMGTGPTSQEARIHIGAPAK